MSKVIKHVVAGLILYEDKLFAAARSEQDYRFGKYEFPGGKIEQGETGPEALMRELEEELRMDVKVGDFFMHVSHEYPTFILEMDVYLCSVMTDDFTLVVHQSAGFFSKEEILKLPFLGADKQIVEVIKTDLAI